MHALSLPEPDVRSNKKISRREIWKKGRSMTGKEKEAGNP